MESNYLLFHGGKPKGSLLDVLQFFADIYSIFIWRQFITNVFKEKPANK